MQKTISLDDAIGIVDRELTSASYEFYKEDNSLNEDSKNEIDLAWELIRKELAK